MDKSEKVAILSMIMNFLIFGMKYLAADVSDSIALKAEAFHSFADFIAAITVLAGVKIANRKTKAFPYGLYKVENVMSILISLVIFYSGYEIVMEIVSNNQEELQNSFIAIVSLLISIILTFAFSKYEMKIGKEINSPILIADAAHIRMDVLSNVIVLAAIISSMLGYPLDEAAAIVIVCFIIKIGFQILRDGLKVLLDASLDYETLSKVEKIIITIPQVIEVKSLTGRNSGRFKFIETSILIKTHNLDKAHYIADRIETLVKEQVENIDRILIHYEPIRKEQVIYALPLTDDQTVLNEHFGEALYFLMVTFAADCDIARKVEIIENPFLTSEKGKGILVAEFLVQRAVDFVVVKKGFHSKGPEYVFANSNIEVIVTDKEIPASIFEERKLHPFPAWNNLS